MNNKTINLRAIKRLKPCWLIGTKEEIKSGMERLEGLAKQKPEWSALDILRIPEQTVSAADRLWVASYLIEENILYRFACKYAELCCRREKISEDCVYNAMAQQMKWLSGLASEDDVNDAEKEMTNTFVMRPGITYEQRTALNRASKAATPYGARKNAIAMTSQQNPEEPVAMLIEMLIEAEK